MLIAAAFIPDTKIRTRIVAALRNRATAVICDTPEELLPTVATTHAAIVIAELGTRAPQSVLGVIGKIRLSNPFVPLIAHCAFSKPSARRLLAAGAAGFTDVLFEDFDDDADAFDSILPRGETAEARSRVARVLEVLVLPAVYLIMARILKDLPRTVSVGELVAFLGVSRRTLTYQLTRTALPPHTLITWTRLLLAACLLEDSRRSINQIARDTGYVKADSLRHATRKHAGFELSEAREGGLAQVLDIFAGSYRNGPATRAESLILPPKTRL